MRYIRNSNSVAQAALQAKVLQAKVAQAKSTQAKAIAINPVIYPFIAAAFSFHHFMHAVLEKTSAVNVRINPYIFWSVSFAVLSVISRFVSSSVYATSCVV